MYLSKVQSKHPWVVGMQGKKQIGALTAAKRGKLVTIVACLGAGGDYVPPVLIFPRKNWCARLMKGAPPGLLGRCHPSGWIQSHVFTEWLVHFIQHTRLSAESPIILILDGHYSHTRNMEVIEKAKENPISLVCLPPNTIHRLQPLDRTFMGPLKTYYSEEIRRLLKTGVGINIHDIAESFGNANLRTQTRAIAVSDFKCTGIYPLNRYIFTAVADLGKSNDLGKNNHQPKSNDFGRKISLYFE